MPAYPVNTNSQIQPHIRVADDLLNNLNSEVLMGSKMLLAERLIKNLCVDRVSRIHKELGMEFPTTEASFVGWWRLLRIVKLNSVAAA